MFHAGLSVALAHLRANLRPRSWLHAWHMHLVWIPSSYVASISTVRVVSNQHNSPCPKGSVPCQSWNVALRKLAHGWTTVHHANSQHRIYGVASALPVA